MTTDQTGVLTLLPSCAHAPETGGAPPVAGQRPVLAIDIGGTKIAIAVVEPPARITARSVIRTPTDTDAESAWSVVHATARALISRSAHKGVRGVGISSAGPVDMHAGTISPVMIPFWRSFPICSRARDIAPELDVALVGDGIGTAIGEHWAGAGQGVDNLLGCVVSTGVGGGLILDGRPRFGPTSNAGHVGHIVVDPSGPPCLCGGRGCLELLASGTSTVAWALEHGWSSAHVNPTGAELAAAARSGDPVAIAAFDRAGKSLGAAFASIAALCDLDRVVVSGGFAQAGPVLFHAIDRGVRQHSGLSFIRRLTVRPAKLGTDAGLIGAAARLFAPQRYRDAAAGALAVAQPTTGKTGQVTA